MTTATKTRRRRKAPLVRRFPGEDGQLVTYLPQTQICEVVGISSTTLSCWSQMGHVRMTEPLNGGRNYAVADAARIKLLGPAECRRFGLRLIPDRKLAAIKQLHDAAYQRTRARADFHGEPWDDYDIAYLITNVEAGRPYEVIAKALGRTIDAVESEIQNLRRDGDLPVPEREPKEVWLTRTVMLLTPEETAALFS